MPKTRKSVWVAILVEVDERAISSRAKTENKRTPDAESGVFFYVFFYPVSEQGPSQKEIEA